MIIESCGTRLGVSVAGDEDELVDSFIRESFPRRYIPEYTISPGSNGSTDALIQYKISDEGFQILDYSLGLDFDEYIVEGGVPRPYVNEAPYFFILQVLSRLYIRRGYLVLTDTVSFRDIDGRVHLILGYPHDGKSSLLAISMLKGSTPLTTENTILELSERGLKIVSGTRLLVYDPRIHSIYGLKEVRPDSTTKHGYYIVDLSKTGELEGDLIVDDIVLIHSSFRSSGVEFERVSGRKIYKTLWGFSAGLLRGMDFYDPYPLDLLTGFEEMLAEKLKEIASLYTGRFYEAFGSHMEIYDALTTGFKP